MLGNTQMAFLFCCCYTSRQISPCLDYWTCSVLCVWVHFLTVSCSACSQVLQKSTWNVSFATSELNMGLNVFQDWIALNQKWILMEIWNEFFCAFRFQSLNTKVLSPLCWQRCKRPLAMWMRSDYELVLPNMAIKKNYSMKVFCFIF